jgi:trans-2,3-dihydro-3-hydroxyanthranilate isomerase
VRYAYDVVDVFTTRAFEGNALAVLSDAGGLETETMQRIAREFALSETTFVFPPSRPETAARVRIFTPTMEMPFAGHPTIGTSFVLRELGLIARETERFVLEEGIGDVPVRVERGASGDADTLWLTTPPVSFEEIYDRALCARVLGLDPSDVLEPRPQLVTAGNPTIFIPVRDPAAVDRAWLDVAGSRELLAGPRKTACVFVFARTATGAYSRMFAPEHGVVEDPATGSATGPLAAYMMRHGLARADDGTRFTSEQGVKMGRRSELHVLVHGEFGSDGIEVGGSSVRVASGRLSVP